MNKEINKIQAVIEPLRNEIINHKVYAAIQELKDLRIFMEHHIYAVWDFMSLLKALQIKLTCVTLPWFPVGSPGTRALINEIVAGEESDDDAAGDKKSHYEMYIDAMEQCGADTGSFQRFITSLKAGKSREEAYLIADTPLVAREFVNATFDIIASNQAHAQSSAFTFGREDLIPNMFYSIVNDLDQKFPEQLSKFKYYLERHIEVDGDHHSHMALDMTNELCGQDPIYWNEAEAAALTSLQKRIDLWDAVYYKIANAVKPVDC